MVKLYQLWQHKERVEFVGVLIVDGWMVGVTRPMPRQPRNFTLPRLRYHPIEPRRPRLSRAHWGLVEPFYSRE